MSSAAASRLVGLLRNDSLANLITHQLLGLGRIDQVYEGLVHRGIHVQIFSHCRHVVRSLYQVVWKHHNWHRASASHQVFPAIAAFVGLVSHLGSLRDDIWRYSFHVEVKVLISIHVRCRDVWLGMLAINPDSTGIHAVQLFLRNTFKSIA